MSGDITFIAEGLSIKRDFYASKLSWLRKNVSSANFNAWLSSNPEEEMYTS